MQYGFVCFTLEGGFMGAGISDDGSAGILPAGLPAERYRVEHGRKEEVYDAGGG